MPTVPVPIFESVFKGVDGVELNEDNFRVVDGYRTLKGGTTSRPGSKTLFPASSATGFGFDGMFWWSEKDCVMAVGRGEVWRLTYVSNTPVIRSLSAGSILLEQNSPISMAVDGTYFYACNGGRIVYCTPTGTAAYITDPGAPTSCLHLAYLDGYILAIDGSNKFYWSDVNNGTAWGASNYASASGSSDLLVSIKVLNREIYLFGQRSIEIWENTGDSLAPLSRIPGGFIQSGCCAGHAILEEENSLYWLDNNRRLVRFAGKSVERLSTKFDKELQGLSEVSDATAFKVDIDGSVFFVFCFPLANRTLVYNLTTDDWCEWGKWDVSTASYDRWVGNCYCYPEKWGLRLIGRRDRLGIANMSKAYSDDDGGTIRLARLTGHIDYGTSKIKQSNELRFRAKRGVGINGGAAKLMMRHRIDNRSWSSIKEFSLGSVGEYDIILRDLRRNQFRTKQYEFSATDAVDIVFSQAEEDIEVLR